MTSASVPAAPKRERPTIGVIAGWQVYERTTPNWFVEPLFRGMKESALALGCDVLLSCGVAGPSDDVQNLRPAWPVLCDEADFVPIGPWNCDGLVFISPLRTELRRGYARRLQEEGFPVAFVGSGDGTPAVLADNELGLRQALQHLREHGHRRIAFISGDPLDPGDSAQRLACFNELVPALGLERDLALVEPGRHHEPGGYQAMKTILGRGSSFTAVLASNDRSAKGALAALAEAGLRVPEDVAVVGFDDTPDSAAHVPPLATVRYPLLETGRKVVERVVDVILGTPGLPDTIAIPTTFVGRRSCGCLPHGTELRAAERGAALHGAAPHGAAPHGGDLTHATAGAMAAEVAAAGSRMMPEAAFGMCRRIVQGLEASLKTGRRAELEEALLELLQKLEVAGDHAHDWQAALSVLRRELPRLLREAGIPERLAEAEDLLHLARLALSESAEREGVRQQLVDTQQADRVSALTVPLQSAQDPEQVLALLADHAPGLGLEPVCVALYEDEGSEPAAGPRSCREDEVARSRVRLMAPGLKGAVPGARPWSEPVLLETRRALDEHLVHSDSSRTLVVLPLLRHARPLGFVAFEAATLAPCAAVARQLAVALESIELQAAVRSLTVTDELTGLHNRRFFETELRREVDRARRYTRDVALIMIDVDHFKSYNDGFGHRAGDEALRRVATLLVGSTHRRLDSVCRYGGEEFAVLLAETDRDGARVVAEKMREAIQGCREFQAPITISAGVAALAREGQDKEDLVLRADQALYRAKAEGRNRVCVGR